MRGAFSLPSSRILTARRPPPRGNGAFHEDDSVRAAVAAALSAVSSAALASGDTGTAGVAEMTVTGPQLAMMIGGFVGLGVVVWIVAKVARSSATAPAPPNRAAAASRSRRRSFLRTRGWRAGRTTVTVQGASAATFVETVPRQPQELERLGRRLGATRGETVPSIPRRATSRGGAPITMWSTWFAART